MKYVDEFRDPTAAAALGGRLARLGSNLDKVGRQVNIMEVCGTHTMAISRYAIRALLSPAIRLTSGPGCPVCVTDPGYIDAAIKATTQGRLIATFGDMLNVPGSESTLAEARARGGDVEVCYSPSAAIDLAVAHPDREVVFLAVGFETTIAPTVSMADRAARDRVGNLSLLTAFKRIPPAMRALTADPEIRIDAFLCPAHVSAVIGAKAYEPMAHAGVPCVIAGFEPLDILFGLQAILEQILDGEARVQNLYRRVVRPEGNPKAQAIIDKYLAPTTSRWRGLGEVPDGGLALRPEYADLDAEKRLGMVVQPGRTDPRCLCGEVIKGKRHPPDCRLFAAECTPDHAVGPCMVSQEGTCAAHFKYGREAP